MGHKNVKIFGVLFVYVVNNIAFLVLILIRDMPLSVDTMVQ